MEPDIWTVLTYRKKKIVSYVQKITYLCTSELRYGVMVALGILVPSVQVRILVSQPEQWSRSKTGFFIFCKSLLLTLIPPLHHIEGLLLAALI